MTDIDPPERPALTPANENPWYCLMTLHGEQPVDAPDWLEDNSVHLNNRRDWNKWAARALTEDQRKALLEANDRHGKPRFSLEELTPHSTAEWAELANAFSARTEDCGVSILPRPDVMIDLANTEFSRPLNVSGFLFSTSSRFIGSKFATNSKFEEASFSHTAEFGGANFLGGTSFSGATFISALLGGIEFFGDSDFSYVNFKDYTGFDESKFKGNADFYNMKCEETTNFPKVKFKGYTNFSGAIFKKQAFFGGACFAVQSTFSGTKFSRISRTTFESAIFGGPLSFLNAELEGETSFARATFKKHPPAFHGAKLNEGTAFDQVIWPTPPFPPFRPKRTGDKRKDRRAQEEWEQARNALEADIKNYQRLKQMMETLKKHEDELEFFAREMACKQAMHRANGETGKAWLLGAYDFLSDYGRSIYRPVLIMTAAIIPFGVLYDVLPLVDGCDLSPREALGLSAANTLGIFSYAKDLAGIKPETLSAAARALGVLQASFGALMLFLAGLGLRNRFRMK